MTRKTIPEVFADIDALLADNTTGAVTPAKLRTVLKELGDALKPTVGVLTSPTMAVSGITSTAKTLVGFTAGVTTDATDVVANSALGKLSRPAGGSNKVTVSGSIKTLANKVMTISILRGATIVKSRTIDTSTTSTGFYIDVADFNAGLTDYTVTIAGTSATATLSDLAMRAEAVATI